MNTPFAPYKSERIDGRLFLTDDNLDRGALTLIAASNRLRLRLQSVAQTAGLSDPQFEILLTIAQQPGLDVTSLRDTLGGTTPTIARLLGELDKAGYINRVKSRTDRRRKALELSEKGQNLLREALNEVRADLTGIYRRAGEPAVSGALDMLEAITQLTLKEARP